MVGRLEGGLLLVFAAGLLLIAQPWTPELYRAGLLAVLGASLLIIIVGNIPASLPPGRAFGRAAVLLLVLVCVFGGGYLLVPTLAGLGR